MKIDPKIKRKVKKLARKAKEAKACLFAHVGLYGETKPGFNTKVSLPAYVAPGDRRAALDAFRQMFLTVGMPISSRPVRLEDVETDEDAWNALGHLLMAWTNSTQEGKLELRSSLLAWVRKARADKPKKGGKDGKDGKKADLVEA